MLERENAREVQPGDIILSVKDASNLLSTGLQEVGGASSTKARATCSLLHGRRNFLWDSRGRVRKTSGIQLSFNARDPELIQK